MASPVCRLRRGADARSKRGASGFDQCCWWARSGLAIWAARDMREARRTRSARTARPIDGRSDRSDQDRSMQSVRRKEMYKSCEKTFAAIIRHGLGGLCASPSARRRRQGAELAQVRGTLRRTFSGRGRAREQTRAPRRQGGGGRWHGASCRAGPSCAPPSRCRRRRWLARSPHSCPS